MNRKDFLSLIEDTFDNVNNVSETKGREYAPDADVTDLFWRRGKSLDISPEKVWAIMAGKQWDAIESYCKRGKVLSVESIESRISDLVVYLLLLRAMVADRGLLQGLSDQFSTDDPNKLD